MAILRLLHTLLIRGAIALGLFAVSTSLSAADWLPDSLGRGFEKAMWRNLMIMPAVYGAQS